MKKIVLLLSVLTLFGTQAFGTVICSSLCSGFQEKQIEKSNSHCHQSGKEDQNKENRENNKKMPLDCSVMALLDSLSTLNVMQSDIDIKKTNLLEDIVFINQLHKTELIVYIDRSMLFTFGKMRTCKNRPIYLLTESFLI